MYLVKLFKKIDLESNETMGSVEGEPTLSFWLLGPLISDI